VTQKCSRSGSLFLSDGQYVGSPIDRYFMLFLSIVLSTSRPMGVISLDLQSMLSIVVSSCDELTSQGIAEVS
jgi:hypothetical protein